jgi:hypothetical protein
VPKSEIDERYIDSPYYIAPDGQIGQEAFGNVFGHDVTGNTIGQAFKFDGSKVAFNAPAERFVVTLGDRKIVVIAQDGNVFGHDVTGRTIGQAFKFNGSKVAFNAPAKGSS